MKKIYIVLSHSGTIISNIVKLYTRNKYSHVSISLNKELYEFYSFGRKKVNNPFNGGFIIENKNSLFYKKYKNTKCTVLELNISEEQYKLIEELLNKYKDSKDIYKYDIFGLLLRVIHIKFNRKNYKYCTKFVKELLEISDVYKFDDDFIKPDYFLNIPNNKIIYTGKLMSY